MRHRGGYQVLGTAVGSRENLLYESGNAQLIELAVQRGLAGNVRKVHGLTHRQRMSRRVAYGDGIEQEDAALVELAEAAFLYHLSNLQKPQIQILHDTIQDKRQIIAFITIAYTLGIADTIFYSDTLFNCANTSQVRYMAFSESFKENLRSFIVISFAYAAIYFVNNALTGFLYLLPGAHLVHIPSGFKLLFVMIGRWGGAAAIGFVSFVNAYLFVSQENLPLDLALASASGLAPLLTWLFFKYRRGIDDYLGNLTYKNVLGMGIFFALLNSASHQLILFWSGTINDFAQGFLVMLVGDITGLYLVLLMVKFTANWMGRKRLDH